MEVSLQDAHVLVLSIIMDLLLETGFWAKGARTILQSDRAQFFLCICENFLCFCNHLPVRVICLSGLYSFFLVSARLLLLL